VITARAVGDFLMTQGGYDRLCQELERLTTISRSEIAERLREVREDSGNPAENGELMDALAEQTMLERRIAAVESRLASARVVPASADGSAGIGSSVRLRTSTGQIVEHELVGASEADASAGRISIESPVGQALLGRRAGDSVEVEAPTRVRRLELLSVALTDGAVDLPRAA